MGRVMVACALSSERQASRWGCWTSGLNGACFVPASRAAGMFSYKVCICTDLMLQWRSVQTQRMQTQGVEMSFEGKVVVIPGGGGGIGKASAARFLDEGALVVLNSRRQPVLDAARAELDPSGERLATFAGDVSVPSIARGLIDYAVERFGR